MITSSALDGGRKRSASGAGLATTPTSLSDAADVPFGTAKDCRKTMDKPKQRVVTVRSPGFGEPLSDDGYSWTLCGLEFTPGAKFPRLCFCCVFNGCTATKQVQRTDDDATLVKVLYDGWHTCVTQEHVTPPMPLGVSSPSAQTVTLPSPVQFFPMRSTYEHAACSPSQEPQDMGHSPGELELEDFPIKAGVISEPAGSGASAYSAPTAEDAENPDVQARGAEHRVHNLLEEDTPSPAQPSGCSKMPQQSNTTCAPSPPGLPPPATQHVTPPSTYEPRACSSPQAPKHMGINTDLTLQEDLNAHEIFEMTVAQSRSKPAGIGASAYSAPSAEGAENPHVQARGVDQTFHNFLDTPTHVQAVSNGSSSQSINVGDGTNARDCVRTKKRLSWTEEEDLILVSAWLSHSNDPNKLNYKKNEQFWEAVTAVYNNKIRKERSRKVKQVKDHFEKIKKALKTYEEEHKNDGPFVFEHCWEVLRKEPKWDDYLKRLRDEPQIGGKQAKKQEKRERKEQASVIDLEDEHDKVVDAQNTANEGHREMLEIQRHVPSENLEARMIARDKDTPEIQMNAAKEQNELLKMYYSLTMKDTTGMSKDEKSEHVLALKFFREKLSGKPE